MSYTVMYMYMYMYRYRHFSLSLFQFTISCFTTSSYHQLLISNTIIYTCT